MMEGTERMPCDGGDNMAFFNKIIFLKYLSFLSNYHCNLDSILLISFCSSDLSCPILEKDNVIEMLSH